MADTMYAWSDIQYGAETAADGTVTKVLSVKAGDSVTKSKLGVSDEDWNELIAAGSVRPYKYPDMPDTFGGSPVDFLRQQASAVADAVQGSGGGYFGPSYEEALTDPESVGVLETPEEKES